MMRTHKQGMSLVEVVVAAGIISIGLVSLIASFTIYLRYALMNGGNVQAAYLAEEGLEAMTFLRDRGWTNNFGKLSTTTTYYLTFNTSVGYWATTTAPQYIDGQFLRRIQVADVKRDAGGVISDLGTYDPNTKHVTVVLEYVQGNSTTTRSISTYIANINGD